jgi:hypothetical protein
MTSKKNYKRQKKQNNSLPVTLIGISVLLVSLVGYNIVRPLPGILIADEGNLHIRPPAKAQYNSYPPTSGPHYDGLAPWGIHLSPIPNELQVHNLEDGGVMVQYNCPEDCSELVSQLTSVVERFDTNVILAPYTDMEFRIALTAWNRLETLDDFDEARILRFIREYRGKDHHQ